VDQLLLQVVLNPDSVPDVWSEAETVVTIQDFAEIFHTRYAVPITQDINRTLATTPPIRLTYFSSPGSSIFALSIHHALYDGTSLPLIISEVENAFTGSATLLQRVPATDILRYIRSSTSDNSRRFWVDYFTGFKPPVSPFDPSWQKGCPRSSTKSITFKKTLSFMKSVATKQQVTLQALLTCTFGKLIATRLYRSPDVSFGVSPHHTQFVFTTNVP